MDSTIIVALVATISAIFAPVLTTYIHDRNAQKQKEIEFIYSESLPVYKEFIAAYSDICDSPIGVSLGQYRRFQSAANQAKLYADKSFCDAVQLLIDAVKRDAQTSATDPLFYSCLETFINKRELKKF